MQAFHTVQFLTKRRNTPPFSADHRHLPHHTQETVPSLRNTALALPQDRGRRSSRGPSRRNPGRAASATAVDREVSFPCRGPPPGQRRRRSNGECSSSSASKYTRTILYLYRYSFLSRVWLLWYVARGVDTSLQKVQDRPIISGSTDRKPPL